MAGVNKLKLDFDFDSTLIGLSSNVEDYRLCWQLNQNLNWQFVRTDNLPPLQEKKSGGFFIEEESISGHVMFSYVDEENYIDNHLISNFSDTGFLIPEYKQCNYFLLMRGETLNKEEISLVLDVLQKTDLILSAFLIDIASIKDLQDLMF